MKRALLLLAVAALTLLVVVLRLRPPAPLPGDAPAEVFSAARASAALQRVMPPGPHPTGSVASDQMRDRIVAELRALGYVVDVTSGVGCTLRGSCADTRNVFARPATQKGTKFVLFAVHYDSVAAGPGASDDGSGVAVALEIARAMRSEEHRNDIAFLIDDAEEAGLLGADAFARHDPRAKNVGAIVNLEARGTSGPSFMFETAPGNAWIVRELSALPKPATSSLFYTIYKLLPNDTDFTVFKRHGMQGLNFGFIGSPLRYHTPQDNLTNLSRGTLQHHGDNALAMMRALADADLSRRTDHDLVWFDVLNLFIIRWPEPWTLPIAIAMMIAIIAGVVVMRRRGEVTIAAVAAGFGWWLLAIALTGLAGYLAQILLRRTSFETEWVAHPGAARAYFMLVAAALACVPRITSRSRYGSLAGTSIALGIISVALAATLPGMAFLGIIPALFTAILLLVPERFRFALAVAAVAAAGLILMPLVWLLYDAVGLGVLAGTGVVAAIVFSIALSAVPEKLPQRFAVPFGVAAVAALVIAMFVPPHTASQPFPLNINYELETGTGRAEWATSAWTELPDGLSRIVKWKHHGEVHPWLPEVAQYRAPAAAIPALPPVFTTESSTPSRDGRTIRGWIENRNGSDRGVIRFQADRVKRVEVDGVEMTYPGAWGKWRVVRVHTLRRNRVPVVLEISGSEPLPVVVEEERFGLPADGQPISASRGDVITPIGPGDVTTLRARTKI